MYAAAINSSNNKVAAFTGGVDGNLALPGFAFCAEVAAFTGGVDGNTIARITYFLMATSPPSRAAWIEMIGAGPSMAGAAVAAFTGGVDGNSTATKSGSAVFVAAFTGGVDGNQGLAILLKSCDGRRLHGRRGLK